MSCGPRGIVRVLTVVATLLLAGCVTPPETPERAPDQVADLAAALRAMGPGVDQQEAARAAELAYSHTAVLAEEYQITDPPLVHNAKVNMGLRPRGLCWHWAEDMETRLKQEGFATLQVHRAIANSDNPFRIDHSTAILSRRGDPFDKGIVLDPWREGGRLFWAPVAEDTRYNWRARRIVMAEKWERQSAQGVLATSGAAAAR
ncbi:hypothetical protein [Rhodovulum adriaticum]|uniref:Lipoprotein n=1 Tax=Rhodovulum adriaticum TaxID=35804 RepID=A0A4R2NXN6_RHOAD|nr:hypothetical protein [Rhodovulum adriaticum]MBK1636393.1 hypothetical protein [Rhodovulum adriaticum]TCP26448.1 hypothetical protein EV656_102415 [Rhodovulum adriaticum]